MGLDMYLYAETSFNRYGADDKNPTMMAVAKAAGLNKVMIPIKDNFQSVEVRVQCAYWRKANQIHSWFVQHVQRGKDDCGDYEVSREQLTELRNLCDDAINTRDATLLAPKSGFFFGNTDINEWYWDNLHHTVRQLDRVLNAEVPKGTYFTYHSSW